MNTPSTTLPNPSAATTPERAGVPWMKLAIGAVVVVVCAALAYWYFDARFYQSTDDAYVGGDVTVMAPKVNGFVTDVLVQDNQYVKAGQVLIRLDSRDYDARLAQANAQLQSAHAAVGEIRAQQDLQQARINEQHAEVASAQAELARTRADQTRYSALVKDEAVSNQVVEHADADLSKARAALDQSQAGVQAADRQLAVLGAQLVNAQANVAKAEAEQRYAALNVEYTTIRAPIDGYVGNRTARVGILANTGVSLLTLIPAQGLWVDANFKEDQLKKMRAGDPAQVQLDAADGAPIKGVVESLAPATGATFSVLPAENATGNFTKIVQRVPVRIRLDATSAQRAALRPGLSATVSVRVGNGDSVASNAQ
ncbi:HlyD family secretion protein [Pararobbsia silviterrae]|uniref:HlyD family secretion protein n=1 Tax=Pararobbsia silviterrae TaxID=1792498 RepID=A0A494XLP9_9BURK|nr:HlyD family secretion protein [Pararobbsia silviterrae]RKP49586.1 HlyD family secretion protein [Pararobbsia silviterrae]